MTRIRRGSYIFVTWVGDHSPYHVHVYRDDELVLKWDLESDVALWDAPTRKILRIIASLKKEGLL